MTGANFAPGTYDACLSVSSFLTLSSCVTSPVGGTVISASPSYTGAYSESIVVPLDTVSGSYYVLVYTGSTVYTSTSFTITAPPAPTLSVSPTSVPDYAGGTITLTGTNFAPGNYFACLSPSYVSTGSCVTGTVVGGTAVPDGSSYTGSYSESIIVSATTPASSIYVIVYTGSTIYESASFAINSPPAVTFSVSPTSVPDYTGGTITLTGTNFAPSTYFACLSTSYVSTGSCVTGTSTGGYVISSGPGYTGSYSESISVPPNTAAGSVYYMIVYSGSTVYYSASFTIDSPPATTFSISPISIPPDTGTTITLTGANFAPGTYDACLSTTYVTTTSGCVTTPVGGYVISGGPSYTGSYSESISVPSTTRASPVYYVVVYTVGSTTPYISASFSVMTPPILTVSPQSGLPGKVVTLSGSGYLIGMEYSDCLSTSSSAVDCVSASAGAPIDTSFAGVIPAAVTVTVPSGTALGPYFVIVYTGPSVVSDAPFTVAPTSLTISSFSASPTVTSGGQGTIVTVSWSAGTPGYTLKLYSGPSSSSCSTDSTLYGTETTSSTSDTFTVFPPVPTGSSGLTTYYCATVTDSASNSASSSTPLAITIYPYVTFPVVSISLQYIDSGQSATLSTTTAFGGGYPAGGFTCQWLVSSNTDIGPFNDQGASFPCTAGSLPTSSTGPLTASSSSNYYYFELSVWENGTPNSVYYSNSVSVAVVPDLGSPGLTVAPGAPHATSAVVDYPNGVALSPTFEDGLSPYTVDVYSSPTSSCSSSSTLVSSTQFFSGYEDSIPTLPGPFASYPTNIYYCDTVTDSSGAGAQTVSSSTVEVTVYSTLEAPTVMATPTVVDQGQTSLLTSSSIAPSGDQPYHYYWCELVPFGGPPSTDIPVTCEDTPNPVSFSPSFSFATTSATKVSQNIGSPNQSDWRFQLTVVDSAGYETTTSFVPVQVDPALVASLTSSVSIIYTDGASTAKLTASVSGGSRVYNSYSWTVPAGLTIASGCGSSDASCTVTSTTTGSYSVGFSVTDSNDNTVAAGPLSLTVSPPPTYSVTFQQTGIPTSGVTWGVTVNSIDQTGTGSSITVSGLTGTPTFTYDSPIAGSTGTRYPCSSACAGSVSSSTGAVSAAFSTQYYFTVVSAEDTALPASGWFDSGSPITESVAPAVAAGTGIQYLSTGWTGTGSVPPSGTAAATFFVITGPSSITWNWAPLYATSTSLSCSPYSIPANGQTTCTAIVVDTAEGYNPTPSGTVTLTTDETGTFSPGTSCPLVEVFPGVASCYVSYTPALHTETTQHIGASYSGDSSHSTSTAGAYRLTVTFRATSTSVSCAPTIYVELAFACTATVTDTDSGTASTPGGIISTSGDGSATTVDSTCTLSQVTMGVASCTVYYTPNLGTEGSHPFSALYPGGIDHSTSQTSVPLTYLSRTTSTAVSCTPPSTAVFSAVTCTATVTDNVGPLVPASPNGMVAFSSINSGVFSPTSCHVLAFSAGESSCSVTYTPSSGSVGTNKIGASYLGDTDHSASSSSTFALTVSKAPSSVSTSVDDMATSSAWSGSEVTGASAFDTSSVIGVLGQPPTGDVTYSFYSGGTCTGLPVSQSMVVTSSGSAPNSAATGPLAAGSYPYSYSASYAGDGNYLGSTSSCEPFNVNQAQPTIGTTIQPGATEPLGTATSDSASIGGVTAGFTPTGHITYSFYSGSSTCGGTPATQQVTVNGNGSVPGSTSQTLGANSYSYSVSYSGDSNYLTATGACEQLVIQKGTATITSAVNPSTSPLVGTTVSDTASATGVSVFSPTGSVTVTLYPGNACSGTAMSTQAGVALGVASAGTSSLHAGAYSYKASAYSGDSNYVSGTSGPCEPFTVQPSSTLTAVACAPNPVTIGSSTTCTATVTGYHPTGSVTFSTSSSTGAFSPTTGQCTLGSGTCSVSYTDTSAGVQTIKASYGGDTNNLGSLATTSLTESYKTCTQVSNSGGQNLKGANLEYCNLGGYNLSGDNLMGANMQYTDLQGANMQGANMKGVDLSNSDLQNANLQGTNLLGATLNGDNAQGANFQGSNLMGDSLQNGNFSHVNFQGSNMMNDNLSNSDFDYSNFTGANTHGDITTGATFVGAISPP